ncbi:hypothetical protein GJ496_009196 [Pomphorhynchus laevis]|nr:hypothetical protein GJ496_009196 [Pomphorhynchus laevis]
MSSTVLTTDQQTLLSLGLSFAPMPREFKRLKRIDSLRYMSRAMFNDKPLETTTAQKQAWLQTPVIQKYVVMPPNPFIENNQERNQRADINELRNNNDILILPADKGKAVEKSKNQLAKLREVSHQEAFAFEVEPPITRLISSNRNTVLKSESATQREYTRVSQCTMNAIFDEIIIWRPNLFRLSRCSESKTFISELTTIYELASVNECSLKYAVIFCQLILHRPPKSNQNKLKQTLSRRFTLWHSRDLDSMLFEA